jgi:hypothetical protein
VTHQGKLFAHRRPADGWPRWDLALQDRTVGTVPAIEGDTALVIDGDDLVAIDLVAEATIWAVDDGFTGSASIADGLGYAIRYGEVVQVDLTDGYPVRTFPGDGALAGKIAVTDDVIVAGSPSATFVYSLSDGVELDVVGAGGEIAVGEGILVIADGDTLDAFTW